jgi:hypothetical protein
VKAVLRTHGEPEFVHIEDISARSPEAGGADPATDVGRALARVVAEIDEIAQATFRSITIGTMLMLVERERGPQARAA